MEIKTISKSYVGDKPLHELFKVFAEKQAKEMYNLDLKIELKNN